MEEKEKKERTVIHLYIKENDTHHYFGSIANVFEYFSPDILGISYGSLRNYGLSNEKTFQNSKCIIRKGTLLSKSGNRGKKKIANSVLPNIRIYIQSLIFHITHCITTN